MSENHKIIKTAEDSWIINKSHLLKKLLLLFFLPAHVTINQQKTINMQMCYLVIKILI